MPFRKTPDNPVDHTDQTLKKLDKQLHTTDTPDETKNQVKERIKKLETLKARSQATEEKTGDELMFHPELKNRIRQTQAEIQAQIDNLHASLQEFNQADQEVEKYSSEAEPFDFDNDPELQDEVKLAEKLREMEAFGKKIGELLKTGEKKEVFELLSDVNNWTNVNEYFQNKYLQDAILDNEKEGKNMWDILVVDHDGKVYFILIPIEYKTEIESTIFPAIKDKTELEEPEFIDLEEFERISVLVGVRTKFNELLDDVESTFYNQKKIISALKNAKLKYSKKKKTYKNQNINTRKKFILYKGNPRICKLQFISN